MRITLKLIGPLIYSAGFSEKEIKFSGSATVASVLPFAKVVKTRPMIITRNGKAVIPADVLEDGDRIVISPLYSGG
jgi:sulfur carrier protein ThiS